MFICFRNDEGGGQIPIAIGTEIRGQRSKVGGKRPEVRGLRSER
jgi:hypothetical protein